MDNYTIYCTERQVKRAIELGAPIEHKEIPIEYKRVVPFDDKSILLYHKEIICPTAEQMIGWLEEQESGSLCIILRKDGGENGHYNFTFWIRNAKTDKLITTFSGYHSLKKVTIAAIDAALDYLENIKQ